MNNRELADELERRLIYPLYDHRYVGDFVDQHREAILSALRAAPEELQKLVDEQAEDAGLWFIAQTAAEAYLQQELRRLHAAIEQEPPP